MPESNEERNVEDVLSSVRRLVSGEISGRRPSAQAQALVLTPNHRVSEARETAVTQSLEDRIAELEAQLAGRQDEWEPDGSEDPATHRPSAPIVLRSPAAPEPEVKPEDDDSDAMEMGEDLAPAPQPRSTRRLSRIELIDTAPAEDDLPGKTSDADGTGAPEAEFDKDLAQAVANSVNAVIEEISGIAPDKTAADAPDHVDVEQIAEDIADEMSDRLDAAGALHGALDRAETDAGAKPADATEGDATAPQEPAPGAATDTDADPLDPPLTLGRHAAAERLEDDLRDIVAELIREELQGELGARITRNVRKLVRREIQRALSARDLS